MHAPAPWEAAIQAHHEVLHFLHGRHAEWYLQSWCADFDFKYGQVASQPCVAAAKLLLPDVYRADPIYISPDMQQVVYSAMKGFDPTEEMGVDDFFIPNGFAYLPEPFFSITVDGGRLAWRAISWKVEPMFMVDNDDILPKVTRDRYRFTEDELRAEGVPIEYDLVARISMWAHMDDEDDFPMPPGFEDTLKILNTKWLVSHMTAIPIAAIPDIRETRGEGDATAEWLNFLRVLNRVMAEKVIVKARHQAPRPYRREAQRRNWPVKDVVVVELRRHTTKGEHDGENGGREYTHRWMVEGHWRNQWYPSMKKHRQKYIASYVKGPDDKPFIDKGRVWNLDR